MKQHPVVNVSLLVITASSLLFGMGSYLSKEREIRHRMSVEESLIRATREKLLVEKELETQNGKTDILERQLLSMQRTNRFTLSRLRGLERRFSTLQKDNRSLESKLTSLKNRLQFASSEKENPLQEVDLGQIVVSATPNLEGKVIAINRPFQFVVVDLGNHQNLSVGTVLSIYRDKDFIGRIQVEEVRETVAACRILPQWTRRDIQENDLVKEL